MKHTGEPTVPLVPEPRSRIDLDQSRDLVTELLEAQTQLRSVLDNLPAMIGYWDTALRNTMANQAYVEWFGFTPEQMRGKHIREVLGEELFALNEPYMRLALQGEPQLFDRTIVDTHGARRHTQASYVPDLVDGQVRGFFVLVTDITARKIAESALADETERVRTILDAVTDAVISLDLELRVTDVNAAAGPMTGWASAESLGKPVAAVVRVADHEGDVPVVALCQEVLATGRVCRRSDRDQLLGRRGLTTPVDWLITPLRSANGEPRGVVLTLRDVRNSRRILEETKQRALHDPLTGLKNRRYLEQLQHRRHADVALPSAVIFLDLDGFKGVNDTAGHLAGDTVLCQVTDVLRSAVRESDEMVRMGGDEFAVLLHDCTLADATRVADTILHRVEDTTFTWHGWSFRLGVSAGLALEDAGGADSVDELIGRADDACYLAKRAGGHAVVVAGAP
ncbi:MAG: diguanylate cyclase [Mycobacteriales bacterium]